MKNPLEGEINAQQSFTHNSCAHILGRFVKWNHLYNENMLK